MPCLTKMVKRYMDSPKMMVNVIMVSMAPDHWCYPDWSELEDKLNQLSYRQLLLIFVRHLEKATV